MKGITEYQYWKFLRVIILMLFYLKIVWMQIWALCAFFPYEINMVWIRETLLIDYLVFYVYCRRGVGLRRLETVILVITLVMSLLCMAYFWSYMYERDGVFHFTYTKYY